MNQLMRILADNRGAGHFNIVKNSDSEATIYIYDAIVTDPYWGGIGAADFVRQLNELQVGTIHLRINSPGGEIFAAQAMCQAIREHAATVIAHVDGYAASAASWLALSCDQVLISEGGYFMIHKAMTIAWGNADEFRKQVDLLDKLDATLVASYVTETGQEAEKIADWMAAETWFNAEESVQYGFADAIAGAAPKNVKRWNMAAYEKAPQLQDKENTNPPPANDAGQADTEHLRRRLALVELQAA